MIRRVDSKFPSDQRSADIVGHHGDVVRQVLLTGKRYQNCRGVDSWQNQLRDWNLSWDLEPTGPMRWDAQSSQRERVGRR
jgi:hypothetical protein